jgi:hypothetical protein
MRKIIFIFTTVCIIGSCRHSVDDLGGGEQMTGKVYLVNPYDTAQPVLQSGQSVLLQRITDTPPAAYLFSVQSNAAGEFAFNFLYKDTTYKLYAELRTATRWDNSILYTAALQSKPAKGTLLTLQPDTSRQNGLFFVCNDSVSAGVPGIIPKDSIYIYASSVLAIADSATISGNGASYFLVANMNGKALKMNLPYDRPLYINAACSFAGKRYRSKLSVARPRNKGIDTLVLRLIN